jgi:PASTA domain
MAIKLLLAETHRRQKAACEPPTDTHSSRQEDIMRISVPHRVFALCAAVAAMLALSPAAPVIANAAPTARTVQPQATVTVPDVVGKNVGIAINELQARGLVPAFKETQDNFCRRREFQVVHQSPAAGSRVAVGSVVTLTFVVWPRICP